MAQNKVLWLIDAAYLVNAQRSIQSDYLFDYLLLRTHLERESPIWKAYYFNSVPNSVPIQQSHFHGWLSAAPPHGPQIIVKLYQLRTTRGARGHCSQCHDTVMASCPRCGPDTVVVQKQVGVDVGIVTLALSMADQYDTLVLSSGDADLIDAIDELLRRGKRFELLCFREGCANDLQARADRIHWIDDFADEVRQRPDRGSGSGRAAVAEVAIANPAPASATLTLPQQPVPEAWRPRTPTSSAPRTWEPRVSDRGPHTGRAPSPFLPTDRWVARPDGDADPSADTTESTESTADVPMETTV